MGRDPREEPKKAESMSDLAELERRITAALARIGAGLDALSVAGAEVREAEAMMRVVRMSFPAVAAVVWMGNYLERTGAWLQRRAHQDPANRTNSPGHGVNLIEELPLSVHGQQHRERHLYPSQTNLQSKS